MSDFLPRVRLLQPLLASMLLLVILPGTLADPDDTDSQAAEMANLLAPTLGRPALLKPGESFPVSVRLPDPPGLISFQLVSSRNPRRTYPLDVPDDALATLALNQAIRVHVPTDTPTQIYDLVLLAGAKRLVNPHCVAVGNYDDRLRIVHLANMNLGDVGASRPDRRFAEEINLVAPSVIVATGDYVDATHPDRAAGWRELLEFFRSFDAPVIMACGDHDSIEWYSRDVAPSPVGVMEFGAYRGLILYDLPRAPIVEDAEQLDWLERNLNPTDPKRLTFVVTHDDTPNLLYHWQRQGLLAERLRAGRIGLWFTGGHRDWAGWDYRELIEAAQPMLYIRTHQSSAAPRGGSDGICHYRVIDVADGKASFPQAWPDAVAIPPSIPMGLLHAHTDGPNDGTRSALTIAATNNHAFRMNDLSYTVRLRKIPDRSPWCRGGRLTSAIDCGDYWECRIAFDLPDKGASYVLCGAGPDDVPPELSVVFDTPEALPFRKETTSYGLPYYRLLLPPPRVRVTNDGKQPAPLSPLIRLDGDLLAYRPVDAAPNYATAYRFLLNPGESADLEIDLSAVRVSPGRHDLQVYLDGSRPGFSHSQTVLITEAK